LVIIEMGYHLKTQLLLVGCLTLCLVGIKARAADVPATAKPLDPVLQKLAQLVGGVWVNDTPGFVVENRFAWGFNKTVIQGRGILGKGSPGETYGDSYMGYDSAAKNVYYVDVHGGDSVLKGTVATEGDDLVFDFAAVVGTPGKYRETLKYTGKDEYKFTLLAEQKGQWKPIVAMTMHRKTESDPHRLVTEAVVDAPREQVWKAFTTKAGQESWNVAHAEIDCRPGGKMLTHYDASGKIGDPNTIENMILAIDPGHMITIQVGTPPAKFPFKEAIKRVSTVIYFEDVGSNQTRVRAVGTGYGDDEESAKLRKFFESGNAFTMKKLQERFAKKAPTAVKSN
jgi:uncharacterized protein YndB with AHSA1/START domain